jgi:PAS domain S-box-containing protein
MGSASRTSNPGDNRASERSSANGDGGGAFSDIVRKAPFGILIVDADFRLAGLSDGAKKAFEGIDPLIGRDFGELLHVQWPAEIASGIVVQFRHTLETGESFYSPAFTKERSDRSAVESYDWKIDRIMLPDGRFGVVCYFNETTERVQTEEELQNSQVRLKMALKAGRLGLWELNSATGELECSDTCKANFGRPPDASFTYQELTDSIHPDDRERWSRVVDGAIEGCSDFELEYRTTWPDGSLHWILVRGTCFPGDDGKTTSLAGITADITDRKAVEEKLIEGSEFNQEIIDSLASHVSVLDKNGVITAVNEAWRRFACANGADWTMRGVGIGIDYLAVCDATQGHEKEDADIISRGIRQVLSGEKQIFTFEYPCHSPTQQRWFLLSVSPLRSAGGGAVVAHTNITERRMAEEALRKSQERFEIVKDGAEIGFWFCDLPFDELIWDTKVKEHFWLEADARVTIDTFYEQIHPEDREITRATIEDSIANKTRYQIDYRTVSPGGEIKWIRAIGRTFYDANGSAVRFDGVTLDITDRKRAEERLSESEKRFRFRDALGEATRTASDPAEVMTISSRLLGEHMGVTRCAYAEVDADNDTFVIYDDWRLPGVNTTAGTYSLDLFGRRAAADMRDGRVLVVRDVDREMEAGDGADMFNSVGIKAIICAPLVKEGKLRAMMAVHNATARDWTPEEIALVREVAERSWAHIERIATANALAASEERFRTLFESIDEGFVIIEVDFDDEGRAIDYRHLEANPAFEEHTGLYGTLGRSVREVVPNLEEYWFERYGHVVRTGETVRFESYAQPLNRWFGVYASRIGAEGSQRVAVVFANITERKQAEQALRESEERFRNMADNAPVMIWVTEADGMCTYLSQSWYEFTGQTPENGLGLGWVNATHPDDAARTEEVFLAANARRAPFRLEYRLRRADGEYRWALDSAQPRFGAGGEFLGYIGSVIDIDDRKEAEELLRRTNDKLQLAWSELRATYDQSPIGLCQLDTELRFIRVNEQLAAMNGVSAGEHLGRTIFEVVPDLGPKVAADLRRVLETGVPVRDIEVVGETPADPGIQHTWLESWFPMHGPDGRIIGLNLVAQDITNRRVAEKAIRDRELLESAVKFQEAERRRIARDLHDQLGQQLTGLRLTLADLCEKSAADPEISEKLRKAQANALALDKDVSSLAFELRANILYEQNLAEALENFVAEWSRNYGIRGDFQVLNGSGKTELPGEVETNLYRIAQEALNNATKHARAEHVDVILEIRDESVRLIVEDDGVGFDPAAANGRRKDGHGLGLVGMRERVDLLRGNLEIDSTAGQGTTVFVTVPLLKAAVDNGARPPSSRT